MNTPPAPLRIGTLVPLSRPGWVEAGRHLLTGLELAAADSDLPLELLVRDTAADPAKAAAAVDELAGLGVAALAGEYHSVVARAAATRADALGLPYLCSYLPERLTPLGTRVATALRDRLGATPSFVAFEGYDTIAVLAEALRSHGPDIAASWPHISVEGTRGRIQFSRAPGISVWQWAWPPVQVADRDPAAPDRFRVLYSG